MMIAVEGMDGSGKTEVANFICEKYDFDLIEKPLHYFYNDGEDKEYHDFMTAANRIYDIDDLDIKTWYFALGNIYVARMFKGKDIVIDRHFVSNYYWNGNNENEYIYDTLIKTCGVPDLTILLYATPKTRMNRIRLRDNKDPDLSDPDKLDDGFEKMLFFIKKFNLPHIVIDTENITLEEVKELVDKEIKKLRGEQRER